MLIGMLSSDLKPLAGNDERAYAMRAATESSSIVLTIINALETIFRNKLHTTTTLSLHVIGASSIELEALMLFEEILHLLPGVQSVDCSFAGLELPKPIGTDERLMLDCCERCAKASRTRSIEMFKDSSNDFINIDRYTKPNLAVALQKGHDKYS
jgi:mitochondrial splicing suppressor protein 51